MVSSVRASTRGLGSGLLLLLTLGCTGYDFDRVRQDLAGASPARVRACLGTPDEMTIREDDELLHYSRTIGRRASIGYSREGGVAIPEPGSLRRCEYVFRVSADGVDGFAVRGRTEYGLRDDQRCLYRLSRCLAPEER